MNTFLLEHDISAMNWPACFPDSRPIENLWSILKQEIHQFYPHLLDSVQIGEDPINAVVGVWGRLGEDLLTNLYDTMPSHSKAVIKVHGWYTK